MSEEEKQTKIRKKAEKLYGALQALQKRKERILLDIRYLHLECTHPKAYNTSHQGDQGTYCPDCRQQS